MIIDLLPKELNRESVAALKTSDCSSRKQGLMSKELAAPTMQIWNEKMGSHGICTAGIIVIAISRGPYAGECFMSSLIQNNRYLIDSSAQSFTIYATSNFNVSLS
jgi:hypothetical protein